MWTFCGVIGDRRNSSNRNENALAFAGLAGTSFFFRCVMMGTAIDCCVVQTVNRTFFSTCNWDVCVFMTKTRDFLCAVMTVFIYEDYSSCLQRSRHCVFKFKFWNNLLISTIIYIKLRDWRGPHCLHFYYLQSVKTSFCRMSEILWRELRYCHLLYLLKLMYGKFWMNVQRLLL